MRYKNLQHLNELAISSVFTNKNNSKKHFFERGDVIFYNNCFIMHIYAYMVENIPYINLYIIKNEVMSNNIDSFLNKADLLTETKQKYSNFKNEYLDPITWNEELNKENCLKMEQNYLTYLSVLNIYMNSCFKCSNFSKTTSYLDEMTMEYKMKFENLQQNLIDDGIYLASDL